MMEVHCHLKFITTATGDQNNKLLWLYNFSMTNSRFKIKQYAKKGITNTM